MDKPPHFVFLSGHHRPTQEAAIYCHLAGIRLSLPPGSTRKSLKHYTHEGVIGWLGLDRFGVNCYPTLEAMQEAVTRGDVDGFFISVPEHIECVAHYFGEVPVAAYQMGEFYDQYKSRGLKNFLSPSREGLKKMGAANELLWVKVRDFEHIDAAIGPEPARARNRAGFYA
jgi:hypothetical protein